MNKTIQIWDADGIFVKSLATNESVLSLSPSPNGKYLVSSTLSEDVSKKASYLKLWDPNTGTSLRAFAQFHTSIFSMLLHTAVMASLLLQGTTTCKTTLGSGMWQVVLCFTL